MRSLAAKRNPSFYTSMTLEERAAGEMICFASRMRSLDVFATSLAPEHGAASPMSFLKAKSKPFPTPFTSKECTFDKMSLFALWIYFSDIFVTFRTQKGRAVSEVSFESRGSGVFHLLPAFLAQPGGAASSMSRLAIGRNSSFVASITAIEVTFG